jgi:hypothetical protein
VQDGLRDGEHIRDRMHGRFVAELTKRSTIPTLALRGPLAARLEAASRAIEALIAAPFDL